MSFPNRVARIDDEVLAVPRCDLAAFKRPKRVIVVDGLPRHAVGNEAALEWLCDAA